MSKSSLTAFELLRLEEVPDAPVFVLEGSEEYLAEQVTARLKSEILEAGFADFNHQVVRCAKATGAGQLLDAMAELPVMTARRLLELRDVAHLSEAVSEKAAQALAESARSGLVAVLTYDGGRKKSVPPLVAEGRRLGITVQCSLSPEQLAGWVRDRLAGLGVKAGSGAVEAVVERTGQDLRLIASHLERLALFVGKAETVTRKHVEELVPLSSVVQMWRLTDAVGKRNFPEANRILELQLARGEGAGAILGYVNSYVVSLIQIGGLSKELGSPAAVAKAIPRKKEFQVKKSLQELKTWGTRDLEQAFEMMARADQRIKTGSDPRLVLELLLLQLCNRRPGR